ncbi:hypothetical protein [Spirochaeta africana]|uniref:Uncharacterized protein n=1 Tax=Spirochaeta africana (strain ATCC 700263 / DSM 8902 / Z-7692) TaxID=889378 RepID=H9UMA3_SPIAZ|nr:hypothetical protein [Spirochaeta africana]AFG38646.1 hypothetical protein Spiaf_2620 [Spirochaeta africana DSM 8902]
MRTIVTRPVSRPYRSTALVSIAVLVLLLALLLSACSGPFQTTPGSGIPAAIAAGTREVDFAGYRGTPQSLPGDMFVEGENGAGVTIADGYEPFAGVYRYEGDPDARFSGFAAASEAGSSQVSFAIRERGEADLRNARLFYPYTNTTRYTIAGFRVHYYVEVWFVGVRDNRIRLKYHTDTSGFGDIDDIVSTPNPRLAEYPVFGIGFAVNGREAQNRTLVQTEFLLPSDQQLQPGEKAWFRWQYSNGVYDDGESRSALGISDIVIEPIIHSERSSYYHHSTRAPGWPGR